MTEKLGVIPECAGCEKRHQCPILNKGECPRVKLERLVKAKERKGN